MMFMSAGGGFLLCLFLSIIWAFSASSLMTLWVCLEMNMLSFIPMLTSDYSLYSLENSLKYFLVQSLASIWFLLSAVGLMLWSSLQSIAFISMMFKLGLPPFHGWFMSVLSSSSWWSFLLLSTTQKIIPFIVLTHFTQGSEGLEVLIATMLTIIILGSAQMTLRNVFVVSSMNNLVWMFLSLVPKTSLWAIYMAFYFFMLAPLAYFFFKCGINTLSQLSKGATLVTLKLFICFLFLSLGGLPPLMGFLNKLMVLKALTGSSSLPVILMIITSSLILLSFYLFMSYLVYTSAPAKHNANSTLNSGPWMGVYFVMLLSLMLFLFLYMSVCTSNFGFLSYSKSMMYIHKPPTMMMKMKISPPPGWKAPQP